MKRARAWKNDWFSEDAVPGVWDTTLGIVEDSGERVLDDAGVELVWVGETWGKDTEVEFWFDFAGKGEAVTETPERVELSVDLGIGEEVEVDDVTGRVVTEVVVRTGILVLVVGMYVVLGVGVVVEVITERVEEALRLGAEEVSELGMVVGAVAEAIEEGELTVEVVVTTGDLLADLGGSAGAGRVVKDGPLVVTLVEIEVEVSGGRVEVVDVETELEFLG